MRNIEILKGSEITKEKIVRLRKIAKKRYSKYVYESTFWDITTLDALSKIHGISPSDEILVLGTDWFLCYWVSEDTVEFLEWVSLNIPGTKVRQSIEMMMELKNILLNNADKRFVARMRHNGSYPFYLNMLKRGYFEEKSHIVDVDDCNDITSKKIRDIDRNYVNIEEFLESKKATEDTEFLTYIMHDLVFNVSDTFVEHYKKR